MQQRLFVRDSAAFVALSLGAATPRTSNPVWKVLRDFPESLAEGIGDNYTHMHPPLCFRAPRVSWLHFLAFPSRTFWRCFPSYNYGFIEQYMYSRFPNCSTQQTNAKPHTAHKTPHPADCSRPGGCGRSWTGRPPRLGVRPCRQVQGQASSLALGHHPAEKRKKGLRAKRIPASRLRRSCQANGRNSCLRSMQNPLTHSRHLVRTKE